MTDSIFPLRPLDSFDGVCNCCGDVSLIRFIDKSTGERFGMCCLLFYVRADTALRASIPVLNTLPVEDLI